MRDKVGIITPTFNRAYILKETAESVFAQTHQNWEWIIVDDGSTDESWALIQSLTERDPRVKGIQRTRSPKGASTCRNIGVQNTDADWLIFLDSDDLLHANCMEQRLETCKSVKDLEVFYFPTLIFEDNQNLLHLWDDAEHPIDWLEGVLTMTPPCQSTGTFWPRQTWDEHGSWREGLAVWQDIELHARAHWSGVKFKAAQNAFPDFYLRVSPDSLSRVGFHSLEKLESRLIVIRECWSSLAKAQFTEAERKAMAAMTLSAIRNAASLGMYQEIRSLLALNDTNLSTAEQQLAKLIVRSRRWKLDKLPMYREQIQRRWKACFPPYNRKLGAHRWTPEKP